MGNNCATIISDCCGSCHIRSFPKKYTRMTISVTLEKEGKVIEYVINLHR